MARDNFNASLDVRQQYLSLLYHKFRGEANWTLIDQGRVASPAQAADVQEYNRIGDKNKLQVAGQITTDISLAVYVENDIEELGRFLGNVRPALGWAGTEVIQLDPTIVADLKIVNFDGITTAANVLFTEYINEFKPFNLAIPLDADGNVRIAELSGAAVAYYIIPEASV
jgi:hypothetical protein